MYIYVIHTQAHIRTHSHTPLLFCEMCLVAVALAVLFLVVLILILLALALALALAPLLTLVACVRRVDRRSALAEADAVLRYAKVCPVSKET